MLRLMLMGIGLGVITGSALKMLAPQVETGQLQLPEWLSLPSNDDQARTTLNPALPAR